MGLNDLDQRARRQIVGEAYVRVRTARAIALASHSRTAASRDRGGIKYAARGSGWSGVLPCAGGVRVLAKKAASSEPHANEAAGDGKALVNDDALSTGDESSSEGQIIPAERRV